VAMRRVLLSAGRQVLGPPTAAEGVPALLVATRDYARGAPKKGSRRPVVRTRRTFPSSQHIVRLAFLSRS